MYINFFVLFGVLISYPLEDQRLNMVLLQRSKTMKRLILLNTKNFLKKHFKDNKSLNFQNIGLAIQEFEKALMNQGRFDQYLSGDTNAPTIKEKS